METDAVGGKDAELPPGRGGRQVFRLHPRFSRPAHALGKGAAGSAQGAGAVSVATAAGRGGVAGAARLWRGQELDHADRAGALVLCGHCQAAGGGGGAGEP
ncbi:MAG: hypothetical protein EBU90_30520 [Proteobacteria bacterium]|nr:hypothetical protein [Pseudomonadota bacterium]